MPATRWETIQMPQILRRQSRLSLAIALAAGTTLAAGGLSAPAHAQKRGARPQPAQAQEPVAVYSDAVRELYQPVVDELTKPAPDYATVKAQLPALQAAATTPDDQLAVGRVFYNTGVSTEDTQLQATGLRMMLGSGKLAADKAPDYNFEAGRLAYNAQDFVNAARYFEASKAAGSTRPNLDLLIGQARGNQGGGNQQGELAYLTQTVQSQIDAGQRPDEQLLKQGLGIAYNAKAAPQTAQYSRWMLQYYPSAESWKNAIAIQRNGGNYEPNQLLDLLRLARRTDALTTQNDYLAYIQVADARRLPGEVSNVIGEGVSAGAISASNADVRSAKSTADSRVTADRNDLPSLERQARASGASTTIVTAAAHAFLSYGQPATAEALYKIALTKPGIDTNEVQTRLGIAQVDQGKMAEARDTFAKVSGARAGIAQLWSAYATQKAGGTTTAMN